MEPREGPCEQVPWEWVSAPETLLLVLLILLDLTQHSPGIYQHLHLANTCLLMPPAALEEEPGPRPGGGGGVGAPMLAMSSECLLCAPRVVPPPSEWARPSHLQVRAIPPHPRKCAPSFREEKPLGGGAPTTHQGRARGPRSRAHSGGGWPARQRGPGGTASPGGPQQATVTPQPVSRAHPQCCKSRVRSGPSKRQQCWWFRVF